MDKLTIGAMGLATALSFGAGRATAPSLPEPTKAAGVSKGACYCAAKGDDGLYRPLGQRRLYTQEQAKAMHGECEEFHMGALPPGYVKKKGVLRCY